MPHGDETPQQIFGDALYEIYYRFLETEDEYFDYAPAPVPPQGRWRIYGLGLPEQILKKFFCAMRPACCICKDDRSPIVFGFVFVFGSDISRATTKAD